jgi:hypothetical protein
MRHEIYRFASQRRFGDLVVPRQSICCQRLRINADHDEPGGNLVVTSIKRNPLCGCEASASLDIHGLQSVNLSTSECRSGVAVVQKCVVDACCREYRCIGVSGRASAINFANSAVELSTQRPLQSNCLPAIE